MMLADHSAEPDHPVAGLLAEAPGAMASGSRPHRSHARSCLNVGCGPKSAGKLHSAFGGQDWREIRLDIDPAVLPDIVGDMVDLRALVADDSVDAVWSSHNIEHLHAHEVPLAFAEFRRVLKPEGLALLTCPDVEALVHFVAEHGLDAIVYISPAGPIRPLDMLWGHSASIAAGHGFMAHRTGFTADSLARQGLEAGFTEVRVARSRFALWALCLMPECRPEAIAPLFLGSEQHAFFDSPRGTQAPAAEAAARTRA